MANGHCIFCGSTDMSREHIWPKWAAPLLIPKAYKGLRSEVFIVKMKKNQTVFDEVKNHHGHTANKKIPAVCKSCNNNWMSALEARVKDIAIPLMEGKAIDLTPAMQTTLAEWVTLKVFVGENNKPSEIVFPQEMRNAFKENRTIPSCMNLWIGRCTSEIWRTVYFKQSMLIGLNLNVAPNGGRKNVQSTTLAIGELFIFSMSCVTEGIDLNDLIRVNDALVRIWPVSHQTITCPLDKILTSDQAKEIAWSLDLIVNSPRTLWKELLN